MHPSQAAPVGFRKVDKRISNTPEIEKTHAVKAFRNLKGSTVEQLLQNYRQLGVLLEKNLTAAAVCNEIYNPKIHLDAASAQVSYNT